MRVRLPRSLRLGLPAVAVLALALGGCAEPTPAPQPAPAPAAPPTSSSSAHAVPRSAGTAGGDGLTVRYLAANGSIKTVPVEDFPR